MEFFYRLPEVCSESTYSFESDNWSLDREGAREFLAEECAEDYYSHHAGWEISWPNDVSLHATEEGPEVARFSVSMEMNPHFSATLKPPEEIEDAPADSGAD